MPPSVTPEPGTSYAIIVILLTVLAQIVMQILSTFKKKEDNKFSYGMTSEDREKLNKLFEWHDVVDEDGLRLWYVNRTLRRTVEETSETMSDIKDVLKGLKETVSNNTKVMELFVALMTKQQTSG